MIIIKNKKETFAPSLNEALGGGKTWIKADGTPVDMELVEDVLEAAMQDLSINYPSIETVLKHKDLIFTDNPFIDTMATDGISIMMNPAWCEYIINKFGPISLEFVLIHECLHVLFDHCGKHRDNLDKYSDAEKVNYAQDYEINYVIENFIREGLGEKSFEGMTNALGGLYSEEFGKKGLTWEEIYPVLPAIKRKVVRTSTSPEWKRGFADAYNDFLKEVKKSKMIESYEIR